MTTHTHPYSVFIWRPPRSPHDRGRWDEPVRCSTQEWALYIANLMHQDSKAVIKAVRYGITFACWPSDHAVELVEQQIAREQAIPEGPPDWLPDEGDVS